ncbi:MAG: hypothetical protein IJJ23_04780 [Clostridia bacterium]|nr:hypothetical protein [Clostridia bacterium]
METIIVELTLPSTSATFDFQLPSTGRVCDVVNEIVRILEATQQNLSFDKDQTVLCDLEHGCILDPALHIAETSLHDGSKLMLL